MRWFARKAAVVRSGGKQWNREKFTEGVCGCLRWDCRFASPPAKRPPRQVARAAMARTNARTGAVVVPTAKSAEPDRTAARICRAAPRAAARPDHTPAPTAAVVVRTARSAATVATAALQTSAARRERDVERAMRWGGRIRHLPIRRRCLRRRQALRPFEGCASFASTRGLGPCWAELARS